MRPVPPSPPGYVPSTGPAPAGRAAFQKSNGWQESALALLPMCGIVGYVGPQAALDVVVEGLRRLEYRGYDSAGVAMVAEKTIHLAKKAGKISNLEKLLAEDPLPRAGLGLGHTRWATHGAPNDVNAHPHVSAGGRVAVVHNGIIENYVSLGAELHRAGITITSQTDTEIVAHMLGLEVAAGNSLADAMRTICARLQGAFTLVAVDSADPDHVVAARRNSPLVVGVGTGENFVASDVAAFIAHTREAIELGQDQVVEISAAEIMITNFDGSPASVRPYHVDWDLAAAERVATTGSCARRSTSSQRPWPTPCSAVTTRTATSLSTRSGSARRNCARWTRSLSWHAAPPSMRVWLPSTRSSTGRESRARWSSPANSAIATRSSDLARLWWRSASPVRRPTR